MNVEMSRARQKITDTKHAISTMSRKRETACQGNSFSQIIAEKNVEYPIGVLAASAALSCRQAHQAAGNKLSLTRQN